MNRKRVQMLRDMIAGIPEKQVDLSWPFQNAGKTLPKPCGAVACMAGWAYLYPPFVAAGIRKNKARDGFCVAANDFFDTYCFLFAGRMHSEIGTDKEVALARLDKLLAARTFSPRSEIE